MIINKASKVIGHSRYNETVVEESPAAGSRYSRRAEERYVQPAAVSTTQSNLPNGDMYNYIMNTFGSDTLVFSMMTTNLFDAIPNYPTSSIIDLGDTLWLVYTINKNSSDHGAATVKIVGGLSATSINNQYPNHTKTKLPFTAIGGSLGDVPLRIFRNLINVNKDYAEDLGLLGTVQKDSRGFSYVPSTYTMNKMIKNERARDNGDIAEVGANTRY